jgi:hypothetical protein
MEEVSLYLDVFSVGRFCCTQEWVEKYVYAVFKAIEFHLRHPCFKVLDEKVKTIFFLISLFA